MGLFDWLPCCGPRSREEKDTASVSETAPLTAPQREGSILSAGDVGYGTMDQPPSGGLTGEQRARIEEIGRQVGNSMLPIHNTRSPHTHKPTTIAHTASVPSSATSSRPSSPSPLRTGPGMMTEQETDSHEPPAPGLGVERDGGGGGGEVEVVQKRLFVGGSGTGGGAKRGRGRGRGKGRR